MVYLIKHTPNYNGSAVLHFNNGDSAFVGFDKDGGSTPDGTWYWIYFPVDIPEGSRRCPAGDGFPSMIDGNYPQRDYAIQRVITFAELWADDYWLHFPKRRALCQPT